MEFDFRNPDYAAVFRQRAERLMRIRADPSLLSTLKLYYRDHPADFINDWGMTSDTRNVERGLPVNIPFLLYRRQREWIDWVLSRWKEQEFGVNPKSRELGVSWLVMSLSATLCLFHKDLAIGVGSNKLEQVDDLGDPSTLFHKGRVFLGLLPPDFCDGFTTKEKLIALPNGSTIAGEGGKNIGRGGRNGIYFVDEAAHLDRPRLAEASLSQTTRCRIDVSSVNGTDNPFFEKVSKWPDHRVFRFHWREDPRKDNAWYEKQKENLDPVTLAQEVDMDFSASVTNIVIPSAWVEAAVDAHLKLGIKVTGDRRGALDVADEGKDLNAFASAYGMLVDFLREWSGKGSDLFATTQDAFDHAIDLDLQSFSFDSDGLGAGVRGNARVLNEQRAERKQEPILVVPFRGSAGVDNPEAQDVPSRKNKDYFKNLKVQRWWGLRRRFEQTWFAINGRPYDPAMLISLSSEMPLLTKLKGELSQVQYDKDTTGHLLIDKAPEDSRSPNLADAVMILMGRTRRGMVITAEAMEASQRRLG